METVRTIEETRSLLAAARGSGKRIALVPTMGNLHEGHISLVRHARGIADFVASTIFVNPMQFGPTEDLDSYPRTFAADQERLIQEGTDLLLAPDDAELYPGGQEGNTQVIVPGLSSILCGESRPIHFGGVTTVVCMLLNIFRPDVAIFGQKDYQQLVIIKKMVRDLLLPVEVLGCPTVREADGLAMSSRNNYLTLQEREIAPVLNQTITAAAESLAAREGSPGDDFFQEITDAAIASLGEAGFDPDYFAIRNAETLETPSEDDLELIVLAAARLGSTRLIDNQRVSLSPPP